MGGSSEAGARLNFARTVARRVERRAVALREKGELKNPRILSWLNRLSVYLFVLTLAVDPNPQISRGKDT